MSSQNTDNALEATNDYALHAAQTSDVINLEKSRLKGVFVGALFAFLFLDISLILLWVIAHKSSVMSRYMSVLRSQGWNNNIDPVAATLTLVAILVAIFLATSLGRGNIDNLAVQEVVRGRALDELTRVFGVVTALTLHFAIFATLIIAPLHGIWIAIFMLIMSLLAIALSAMCAISSDHWRKASEKERAKSTALEDRINAAVENIKEGKSKGLAICKGISWLAGGNIAVALGLIFVLVGAGARLDMEMPARSWILVSGFLVFFVMYLSVCGAYILGVFIAAPIIERSSVWLLIVLAFLAQLTWALGILQLMLDLLEGAPAPVPWPASIYWLVLVYVLYPWAGAYFWRNSNWWSVIQVPLLRWARNQSDKAIEKFSIYERAAERRRSLEKQYDGHGSNAGDANDHEVSKNAPKPDDRPTDKKSLCYRDNQSALAPMTSSPVFQKRTRWFYFVFGAWIGAVLLSVVRSERRPS